MDNIKRRKWIPLSKVAQIRRVLLTVPTIRGFKHLRKILHLDVQRSTLYFSMAQDSSITREYESLELPLAGDSASIARTWGLP